jgi:hypothetical protein
MNYHFHDHVRDGQYDPEEVDVCRQGGCMQARWMYAGKVDVCRQYGISGHLGVALIHVRAGTIRDHLMCSIRNVCLREMNDLIANKDKKSHELT